jgi:hypothetical protein
VLFICEKYYLRFYRPIADRLVREGFSPIWVALDGVDVWNYDYIDPTPAIETLIDGPHIERPDDIDAWCRFERAVFERPNLFKANYSYTMNVVRTLDRARRLAAAWYESTLALLARFQPHAVFVWNGRYLPYRAVSAACDAAGQLLLTSEIGWIPGTVFLDRGSLSSNTTDLMGRTFESTMAAETDRADAFLKDYTTRKATMVSQTLDSPSGVRQRLLGNFQDPVTGTPEVRKATSAFPVAYAVLLMEARSDQPPSDRCTSRTSRMAVFIASLFRPAHARPRSRQLRSS